jgi:hypothetical protein
MNKNSMTIGFRADLDSGEGDISSKNREKLEELLRTRPLLAWDVIGDWIDELEALREMAAATSAAANSEDNVVGFPKGQTEK